MTPDLLKASFLLDLDAEPSPVHYVGFFGTGDEPRFLLPIPYWEDMGKPSEITVTVEPGDTLNEEA